MEDLSPGAAILKISGPSGEFRFLCPAEMQNLYSHSNDYEAQSVMRAGSLLRSTAASPKPPTLLWHGASDADVSLELKLVVGASIDIDTPGQLMDTMTKLARLAQPKTGTRVPQEPPEIIGLQIGTWFARKAAVMSAAFGFGRPYDPGTGLPFVGFVNFSLKYLYNQMPNAESFRFDRS